jgi:hypothetical protein
MSSCGGFTEIESMPNQDIHQALYAVHRGRMISILPPFQHQLDWPVDPARSGKASLTVPPYIMVGRLRLATEGPIDIFPQARRGMGNYAPMLAHTREGENRENWALDSAL